MKALRLILALAVAAAPMGPALAETPKPEPVRPPKPPAACKDLRALDRMKLDDAPALAPATLAALDGYIARNREGEGAAPPADASIVIRFFAPEWIMANDPATTSTWAAKGADGVWRFSRIDHYTTRLARIPPPPPPPPPGSPPYPPPPEPIIRNVVEGVMAPADVATLEAALADRCRAFEPRIAPGALPLKRGELKVCFDGSVFYVAITQGGETRLWLQACETRWSTGKIARLLESPWPEPAFADR